VIADWRKSSNKKYRGNDDDIEITFEGGFDKKNKKGARAAEEVPSLNKQKKTMNDRKKERLEGKKQKDQER
jgi:hypothetical protein